MSSDRVPDCLMNQAVVQMITSSRTDYQTMMEKIASGSTYLKRSEDPGASSRVQSMANISSSYEQWSANIDSALSWEKATDSSIQTITDTLQRVNELMNEASSGINTPADREAIATEVDTIIESLVQYGNIRHLGVPLYSGTATCVDKDGNIVDDPFTVDRDTDGNITAVYFLGNDDPTVYASTQARTVTIAENAEVKMGVLGEGNNSLFQFKHSENLGTEASPNWQDVDVRLFDELIAFRDNLRNTTDTPDETNCARIQAALDNVLERGVVCYANQSRLDGASSSMTGIATATSERSDQISGLDVSKATIRLNEAKTALQSSIAMMDMIQKMAIQNFV